MIITTTIFGLSIFSFVFMIGIKFFEFNTGKNFIPRDLHIKIEEKLISFYQKIILFFVSNFKKIKILLKNFPMILTQFSHIQWRKISKKVDRFFIKIRYKK